MSSKKIVFQSAEERELWKAWAIECLRSNTATHEALLSGRAEQINPTEDADIAVLAYRARCGTSEGEPSTPQNDSAEWRARWWSELVVGLRGEFASWHFVSGTYPERVLHLIRSLAAAKQKAEAELAELRAKVEEKEPDPDILVERDADVPGTDGCFYIACRGLFWYGGTGWSRTPWLYTNNNAHRIAAELRRTRNFPKAGGGA